MDTAQNLSSTAFFTPENFNFNSQEQPSSPYPVKLAHRQLKNAQNQHIYLFLWIVDLTLKMLINAYLLLQYRQKASIKHFITPKFKSKI